MELTAEQQEVFESAQNYINYGTVPFFVFHGLAGVGKTVALVELARANPGALLATITGRAANNLRVKSGLAAGTIHSALYRLRDSEYDEITKKEDLRFDRIHEAGELRNSVLLLDESSTIDETIARDILNTGAKVVACGDPGQLNPVSGPPFFNTPDRTLLTIHRQAWESPIIRQAHAVRSGKSYRPDGRGFQVCHDVPDAVLLGADAVLCWKNATRHHLNQRIRRLIGFGDWPPLRNETVMCLKNNPEYNVYNGVTYRLLDHYQPGGRRILIDVDGQETEIPYAVFEGIDDAFMHHDKRTTKFAYGYASTVHKFQGSEADRILLYDEYNRHEDRNRFLYTGITRAAKQIVVVDTLGVTL